MGDIIQSTGQEFDIVQMWYVDGGSDGLPPEGAAVCFDPSVSAGDFDEQELHKVVQKPATGNLTRFAGIVVHEKSYNKYTDGTYTGVIDVLVPKRHQIVPKVLVKSNATTDSTLLVPADGEWSLATDAAYLATETVGMACETADTSVTEALKPVKFI